MCDGILMWTVLRRLLLQSSGRNLLCRHTTKNRQVPSNTGTLTRRVPLSFSVKVKLRSDIINRIMDRYETSGY